MEFQVSLTRLKTQDLLLYFWYMKILNFPGYIRKLRSVYETGWHFIRNGITNVAQTEGKEESQTPRRHLRIRICQKLNEVAVPLAMCGK